MRILSVLPRLIHPAFSGGDVRVKQLLKHLARRHEFTLLLFSDPKLRHAEAALVMELERELGLRVVTVTRALPERRGFFLSYEDPAMAAAVRRESQGVDLVHIEFSQMGGYAEIAGGLRPVVYSEHDVSVLSPARSYLRPDPSDGGPRALEGALRRTLRASDRVVATSEADARRLVRLAGAAKLRVVPSGVDLEAFEFRGPAGRRPGSIVYVGCYAHYPNEDAAVRLCREVLPLVSRERPEAVVRLVGSQLTAPVEALAGPGVEVVGAVERVAPYLQEARVFAAPLKLGTGNKGKFHEAFAAGVPVVTTREALEALPDLKDGEHVLLADDARAMAAAIVRLMGDDALCARLARAARAYVERLTWARAAALMDGVYRETLALRKP